MKEYQVYVESAFGSDVLSFSTKEEAIDEAQRWSKEIGGKRDVVVVAVTTTEVYREKGGE